MTFPTIATVASGAKTPAGTTGHPVNIPSGIASGDLLIAFVVFDANPTVTGWPGTWTLLEDNNAAGQIHYNIYYKTSDGTETNFTLGSGASRESCSVTWRITGWDSPTPPQIATSAATTTVNPNPPAITPSWGSADTLFIAFTGYDDATKTLSAYPTNYSLNQTNQRSSTANTGCGLGLAARQLTGTTDDPGTFTLSAADDARSQTIAVRPAAAAPTSLLWAIETPYRILSRR